MKVNVVDKRGKVFGLHPKVAKVLVGKGTVRYAEEAAPKEETEKAAPVYETRMLQAAEPVALWEVADPAPYGYKADGTPKKRPGRPAAVADEEVAAETAESVEPASED